MNILYDTQAMFGKGKYGIKNYFDSLWQRRAAGNSIKKIIPPALYFINNNFSFFINKLISIFYIKVKKYDLFHPTYYNNYFLKYLRKDFVITIYDMIPEIFGGEIYEKTIKNKAELITRAKHIFTISKQTKVDLLKFYPNLTKNKISIVYPSNPLEHVRNIVKIPELVNINFIMYVGNRQLNYKNFQPFLASASHLLKNRSVKLFCAGGGSFNLEEQILIDKLKLKKIILQKDVNPEELKWAYKNASIFVFPSSYEGFGIPIIEAQDNNCLVLCSNNPTFKEIARNSVIYFDNNDFHDLVKKIDWALDLSKDKLKRIRRNGKSNSKKYSHIKSIKKINDIYLKINSSL